MYNSLWVLDLWCMILLVVVYSTMEWTLMFHEHYCHKRKFEAGISFLVGVYLLAFAISMRIILWASYVIYISWHGFNVHMHCRQKPNKYWTSAQSHDSATTGGIWTTGAWHLHKYNRIYDGSSGWAHKTIYPSSIGRNCDSRCGGFFSKYNGDFRSMGFLFELTNFVSEYSS